MSSHLIGNVFFEIVSVEKPWGRTMEANTTALYADMKEYTKKDSSRLQGKLTIERIRTSGDWPKLKAKAACTRHLSFYARSLCERFNSGSVHDQRRLALCKLLCQFYTAVESEGMFMRAETKAEIARLGSQFVGLYSALAMEAASQNIRAWKLTPKFHLFQHLCEWQCQEYPNPRFYWTYADEDMVGSMVEVAQSCHTRTMAETALYKWLVLLFLEV